MRTNRLIMLLVCCFAWLQAVQASETGASVQSGQMTLMGSLETPEGVEKPPVVLIIAGSGPTDRDGNSRMIPGKNNSLRMVAEALSAAGIASLRYDKRGVGASLQLQAARDLQFDDYVGDAAAWIDWLQQSGKFSRIIVLGHSEGSLIAMLAAQRTKVSAVISLCGPADNIADILQWQVSRALDPEGSAAHQRFLEDLKNGKAGAEPPATVARIYPPSVRGFLRSAMAYTPSDEIRKLRVPVLTVGGTHDIQVTDEQVRKLAASHDGVRLVVIEGMNHVLKTTAAAPAVQISSYGDPSLPLASALMPQVLDFIRQLP